MNTNYNGEDLTHLIYIFNFLQTSLFYKSIISIPTINYEMTLSTFNSVHAMNFPLKRQTNLSKRPVRKYKPRQLGHNTALGRGVLEPPQQ